MASQNDLVEVLHTLRHRVYDADSHSIWFGTDMSTIGQARMVA